MNILITGGTGFIGRELVKRLLKKAHSLTILSRQPAPKSFPKSVKFIQSLADFTDLNAFDAVINLAGEPIFDKRWTTAQKQRLLNSRVSITQQLASLIQQSDNPPHTFLSGSATGFYGNISNVEKADESTALGVGFAAEICRQWENAALQATNANTRICLLRTGMVIDPNGGALKRMLPLYRLGLGGKIGSGKQHWAWISLNDQVRAILFLLENRACQGAFNLVAPNLLTAKDFNDYLAKAVKMPAFFAAPEWGLRLLLGERAQLILDNQPLLPRHLIELGFQFENIDFKKLLKQS